MKSGNIMRKQPNKALLAGAAALALLAGTAAASAQNERINGGASAGGSAQMQGSQTGASGRLNGQAGASGRVNGQASVGAQGGVQSRNSAQGTSDQRFSRTQSRNEAGSHYGRDEMRSGNNEYSSGGASRRTTSEAARTRMESGRAANDRDFRERGTERYGQMSSGREERFGRLSSDREDRLRNREDRTRFNSRDSFDRSAQVERGGAYRDFRGHASEPGFGSEIRLSDAQRTRIREQVIDARNAPRIDHVGFDVRVGAAIPRGDIRVLPLPYTLVQLEPRWRGYTYFVYEDEIVVVDPNTMTIVSVIEA